MPTEAVDLVMRRKAVEPSLVVEVNLSNRSFIRNAKPSEPRSGAIIWDLVRPAAQAQ
jgi:hypothetical protein